jgi:hypothetical protein
MVCQQFTTISPHILRGWQDSDVAGKTGSAPSEPPLYKGSEPFIEYRQSAWAKEKHLHD